MAKPTATAASTALPPFCRMSAPMRAAIASCATTMPFLATTACAWPICSSLRAAIGSVRTKAMQAKKILFPGRGAARSGAPLIRDRSGLRARNDPGSAAHHSASLRAALRPGNKFIIGSQHRRQDAVRRAVAVHESLDVDDDLFTHVVAAFHGGRGEMRQQHHLAGAGELDEFRAHRRLVLENVQAG